MMTENVDEFPNVQVGDVVRVVSQIAEVEKLSEHTQRTVVHAESGEFGRVVDKQPGHWPTVQFWRTGSVADCSPEEFDVVPASVASDALERVTRALAESESARAALIGAMKDVWVAGQRALGKNMSEGTEVVQ